ncbi:MAG: hypothetical protein JJ895_07060 [Balneolaceae bacterium]|nr:hypothetical protein [Balneolaceae bacterium]
MLRFFRNIRQKLLENGNISKYFWYAFGEILLVVIGILIALQINNWNEDRKERAFEKYVLTEIQTNLIQDQQQLLSSIKQRQKAAEAIMIINSNVIEDFTSDEYGKHVANLFTFERFFPIVNGYEMLKSNGLTLSSDELRSLLGQYYEYEVLRVQSSFKDLEKAFLEDARLILEQGFFDELEHAVMVTFTSFPNPELEKALKEYLIVYKENHKNSMLSFEHFKSINEELLSQVKIAINDLSN